MPELTRTNFKIALRNIFQDVSTSEDVKAALREFRRRFPEVFGDTGTEDVDRVKEVLTTDPSAITVGDIKEMASLVRTSVWTKLPE